MVLGCNFGFDRINLQRAVCEPSGHVEAEGKTCK